MQPITQHYMSARREPLILCKKQIVSFDPVLDCIVCDMVEQISYDRLNAIHLDMRGDTSGFYKIDGDVKEFAQIVKGGIKYTRDDGSTHCIRVTYNEGDCSYLDYRFVSVNDKIPTSCSEFELITEATWMRDFAFFVVKYGAVVLVTCVKEKVIESTMRYYFKKEVSIQALSVLTGLSFDTYVRQLCTINRHTDRYGYIVSQHFTGGRWKPGVLGVSELNALFFLNSGGILSMIYAGDTASIASKNVPTCNLVSTIDHTNYSVFLIQVNSLSRYEIYSSSIVNSRIKRAAMRYENISKNIEMDELNVIISEYNYDMNEIIRKRDISEHDLAYLSKNEILQEDLLLNNIPDCSLVLGTKVTDDYPDFEKNGHCMIDINHLLVTEKNAECADVPIDIIEDMNISYTTCTLYDTINGPQNIGGRLQEIMLYIRDEDLFFLNMRPDIAVLYDIDGLTVNSDSLYDFLDKKPNIINKDHRYNPVACGHWIKVRTGYFLSFSVKPTLKPRRFRMKILFLSSGCNIGSRYSYDSIGGAVYSTLLCSYFFRYIMSGVPALNVESFLKESRIPRFVSATRKEYGSGDHPQQNSCGYGFPNEYKGPFREYYWATRQTRNRDGYWLMYHLLQRRKTALRVGQVMMNNFKNLGYT
jgi:hypothetical protein